MLYHSLQENHIRLALYCVSWWRHDMDTILALLDLCEKIALVTCEFPSQKTIIM